MQHSGYQIKEVHPSHFSAGCLALLNVRHQQSSLKHCASMPLLSQVKFFWVILSTPTFHIKFKNEIHIINERHL